MVTIGDPGVRLRAVPTTECREKNEPPGRRRGEGRWERGEEGDTKDNVGFKVTHSFEIRQLCSPS